MSFRSKSFVLFACFFSLFTSIHTLFAQTPINPTTWNGSPASAVGPSGFTTLPATITPGAATVNVSQWDRAGVVYNAAGGCYNSTSWQVGGTLATAQANNKYIFFTVANSATTELRITDLFIRSQVSATGPQSVQVQYTIGAVTGNFGPTIGTAHTASPENWDLPGNVCLGPGQTATFKLYGWGATGSAGTLRINDLTSITAGFATPVTATASSSSPVCAGTTLSFFGTAGGGIPGYTYSWAGPAGFASTLLSPTIASPTTASSGVYTLTVTDLLTCSTSSTPVTTTVTINSAPAAITGTTLVCPGLTTTLSSTTTGGTWSSSDGSIATVGLSTGVVTGVIPGTATISYMLSSACVTTTTVTVDTPPAAITGGMSLCQGTTTTLSSTSTPGTWTSSDLSIATVGASTGVVNGISPGTAVITYTIGTGCYTTAIVTVYPFPAPITGPATVCPGLTITLSSFPLGGNWTSGNISIATVGAGTGIVTGVILTGGTTNITYTLPTTCRTIRSVSVNPAPPAVITPLGDTTFCPGGFVPLLANTGAGLTCQWFSGAAPLTGATGATYIANTTGNYRVQVTNGLGCPMMSVPMAVLVDAITATITVPGGVLTDCAATGVTLDATPGTGLTYQWMLGGVPIPGAVSASYTAVLTGSYTVQVINATGCSDISPAVAVTILPSPSAVVSLSGPIAFCQGGSVVLTGEAGASYTYQWHNAPGAITGATNISYTASVSGTYWVDITNTYGCTTSTTVSNVIVNPLPPVGITLGGPKVFCAGGSVGLSAATGYNYQWYRGGVAISGATLSNYTALLGGAYRVRVTDATTGCTDITHADTVVTLVNTPTVLPLTPTKFCWGGSATLSTTVASAGFAVVYQWFFNGVVIPGATSAIYLATVAGDYSCRIIVPGSCSVVTAAVHVTEVPLPDPVITRTGSVLSTSPYFVTYQWYKNLIPITGATTNAISHSGDGVYKVRVTDTNSCQSVSATYVLTNAGVTGIGMTEQPGKISIYPNPASEVVYIDGATGLRAVMSSIDGRKLVDKVNAQSIDMTAFADGVYLLALYDANNIMVKAEKVVKYSR